jgi:protein-S-isoprenylcysteine O-methyltransferase Ste14
MLELGWVVLVVCWIVWMYPFIFRAPHNQQRPSITAIAPTRAGLLMESLAICMAFIFRRPTDSPPTWWLVVCAALCGTLSCILAWGAIRHLGRQFRVHAGLYEDHELVTSGPYALVRHPIYTSLLGMLVCSLLILTPWQWAVAAIALFIVGTEIRVHTEDGLLASRFGKRFFEYRKRVRAYLPFVR